MGRNVIVSWLQSKQFLAVNGEEEQIDNGMKF